MPVRKRRPQLVPCEHPVRAARDDRVRANATLVPLMSGEVDPLPSTLAALVARSFSGPVQLTIVLGRMFGLAAVCGSLGLSRDQATGIDIVLVGVALGLEGESRRPALVSGKLTQENRVTERTRSLCW